MNLIDFTINNPRKQGLDNVMGYNETDLFFVQFGSHLPKNVVTDCSNVYFVDIAKGMDLSSNITLESSNNPTLNLSKKDDKGEFCQKRELCKNVLNYKDYTNKTGSDAGGPGGYDGTDTHFMDYSQLYNFTILSTANLSLGILLLSAAIYSYMY
jgi:hypothetical protein